MTLSRVARLSALRACFTLSSTLLAMAGCSSADSPASPGPGTAGMGASATGGSSVIPQGAAAGTAGVGTAGTAAGNGGASGGAGGTSSGAGSAGVNATSGSGGQGTAGTDPGGRPSGPSPGCMAAAPADDPSKAIQHDLMVTNVADKYKPTYVTRKFYTNLPQSYDHSKPYPVMLYGQGCGQTGPESGPFSGGHFASELFYVQLIPAAVTGDTVVPSNGAPGCFQAGKQGLADSPDAQYFDMVLAEVEQKYCIDRSRVYVAGWSSGAWLSNYLACARGNVITGTAAGSGGLQHDSGTCTGGPLSMIMDGDAGSIMEGGFDIGAAAARDTLVKASGGTTSMSTKLGPDTCDVYAGTNGTVAWCPVGGGHGGPLGTIAEAAWAFWTAQK